MGNIDNIMKRIYIQELNENRIFFNEEGTNLRDLSISELNLLVVKVRERNEKVKTH